MIRLITPKQKERLDFLRALDMHALEQARRIPVPMSARQYFNSQIADSLIVTASTGSITAITNIFSLAQASQAFPIGYGIAAPFAGQVYRFSMGGILTTGTTGTMVITPWYGPGGTGTGVNMGASIAQTYTASLTNGIWRAEGELVFRTISNAATASTAWLTGTFWGPGAAGTAGSAWVQTFGATAAVSVDTSGLAAANTFGGLNFSITFSVAGTVQAAWTSMQSLN